MMSDANPLIPTIFHEPWWLDLATGGQYDVVEVVAHGKVLGQLPYHLQKRALGLSVVDLPPLTHFLGPAIVDCDGKPNTVFSHRLDVTNELIRKFPKTSAFYVKCHRNVSNVLAFQGAGFRAGVQFTHEVHPQPVDVVWSNLRDKARNVIRKAREKYNVVIGTDPCFFMRFYKECIEKTKRQSCHMDINVHIKLIQASMERGCGQIWEAREPNGQLASAIFCAWDKISSYYLLTSRIPTSHPGSTSLLLWEAISDAIKHQIIFDFDGIASEGGARAANNFTPILTPRFTATYESVPLQIYRAINSIATPKNFFYK